MEARYEELMARVTRTEEGQTEILRRLDELMHQNSNNPGFDAEAEGGPRGARRGGNHGRRLELPVFDGADAYGWLNKVDRYFLINRVREEEKVTAVMVVLEGEALNWFQWWEINTTNTTWTTFRSELLRRFHSKIMDNPLRSLLTVKQNGTMADFRKEFKRIVSPLRHEDKELLRGV